MLTPRICPEFWGTLEMEPTHGQMINIPFRFCLIPGYRSRSWGEGIFKNGRLIPALKMIIVESCAVSFSGELLIRPVFV